MNFGFHNSRPTAMSVTIVVLVTVVITTIIVAFVIPAVGPFLAKRETNELIAICAVAVTMTGITVQLILHILNIRRAPKSRLEVIVEVIGDIARITASYDNQGVKRIIPKNVYLFVDQAIESQGLFQFPFLARHEAGENDCVLAKRCKAGGLVKYPDELRDKEDYGRLYSNLVSLKHMSSESILFIDPGERFSEDYVIRLPTPGVYRATAVFTATNADCTCAARQFLIRENGKDEKVLIQDNGKEEKSP